MAKEVNLFTCKIFVCKTCEIRFKTISAIKMDINKYIKVNDWKQEGGKQKKAEAETYCLLISEKYTQFKYIRASFHHKS